MQEKKYRQRIQWMKNFKRLQYIRYADDFVLQL